MNELSLRICRTGNNEPKNSTGISPVNLKDCVDEKKFGDNNHYKDFIESVTADGQLIILKKILEELNKEIDENNIKFLVTLFLNAETKHPVKSFLVRYITKTSSLQQPFIDALREDILIIIKTRCKNFCVTMHNSVLSKLAACIENFPAGAATIKSIEIDFASYLRWNLECCVNSLKHGLSPTGKTEVFSLAHLAMRLYLYVVQRVSSENANKLISMFSEIRAIIQWYLFDDDMPMDTKSVCGILYVSMRLLENGQDSWIDILVPSESDEQLNKLLSHEASQLSLYSAIATVVSIDKLQRCVGDSALAILVEKIINIGQRNSSESVFILCATRTLVQICKSIHKLTDIDLGFRLIDTLLTFIWTHLEHYMDSVRHLTAQALSCIVKYCSKLKKQGHDKALNSLFVALTSLDRTRKSYYLSVASLTTELGAICVMDRIPNLIKNLLDALSSQPVQASATTALETLLQKHIKETDRVTIDVEWIQPIILYVSNYTLDSGILNILENLLTKAVKLGDGCMEFILPHIKQYKTDSDTKTNKLKCLLMLLNVARKSGYTSKLADDNKEEWKGLISYEVLKKAAVNSLDETRILSLTLIVESPKSTEFFTVGDMEFILWYLKYNINAQAPSFRQLTLSVMKKFVKRLGDSYKVLKRQKETSMKAEYYLKFLDDLRALCFDSLVQGANYSRRCVALQMLMWCEQLHLEGYQSLWKLEYVAKLLLCLGDSYENNKSMALNILDNCPVELLKKKYTVSLEMDEILREASSLKPTDCVSAAYKLHLLVKKLPDRIQTTVLFDTEDNKQELVIYKLLSELLRILKVQLWTCQKSVVCAAREAPMYGVLHCMRHFMELIDPVAICDDVDWSKLIGGIITTCVEVNVAVACVVNNSSPEGHLPMDTSGVVITDDGNSGGVRLDDGRQVTAQMVLLCAWRSVKEVSLLLGTMSSRLLILEECRKGSLCFEQIDLMVKHFTKLLAETKHRGAFEQAYVGFTKLLSRLWRCYSTELHELPRACLTDLMTMIASEDQNTTLCATRRSAGLPFMIQALVTTELQVHGNPKCFHSCMATLLRLARDGAGNIETRTHCLNILRALFRNSTLDECVAGYVGQGLIVALTGFEGETWAERNSSTLLFSALMVRIFGVQRSKDSDNLCIRNKMTGRIFFLRYPHLYDFMLKKLEEVGVNGDKQLLSPSLYPVLLLLARLYPSSLEGTVSNLKLVAYVPYVLACAKSSVLKTRQLAAKAMLPLVSPENYAQHVANMFEIISDPDIKRNYCHGILLQLTRLLNEPPKDLMMNDETNLNLSKRFDATLWILEQGVGEKPCYLLVDEYVKIINLLVWRFPAIVRHGAIKKITTYLDNLIFLKCHSDPAPNRDICLSNALFLYLIFLNKFNKDKITNILYKSLQHSSYEVTLTSLNYLLMLYKNTKIENNFEKHLNDIYHSKTFDICKNDNTYIKLLCDILYNNKYLECQQKCLKLLTLEMDSHRYIIKTDEYNKEIIVKNLIEYIKMCNENLIHMYLESLCDYATRIFDDFMKSEGLFLEVLSVLLDCSSSNNSEETRSVVARFLERNIVRLLDVNLDGFGEKEKFKYRATVWSIIITMLEDDEELLRQRTADAIYACITKEKNIIPSKCREAVVDYIQEHDNPAIFVTLALLDFKSEVCLTDESNDECRVFDQNERYNVFLEETIWTRQCAKKIIDNCSNIDIGVLDYVLSIIDNDIYKSTNDELCLNNVVMFKRLLKGDIDLKHCIVNPKLQIFIDDISC